MIGTSILVLLIAFSFQISAFSNARGGQLDYEQVTVSAVTKLSSTNTSMKILQVVGLGLLIIMLKFLVPRIFSGFEGALLALFDATASILGTAKNVAAVTPR